MNRVRETQFHVAVADGIIPFGPELRSLAVFEDSAQSWIFGIVQGAEDEGYPTIPCLIASLFYNSL